MSESRLLFSHWFSPQKGQKQGSGKVKVNVNSKVYVNMMTYDMTAYAPQVEVRFEAASQSVPYYNPWGLTENEEPVMTVNATEQTRVADTAGFTGLPSKNAK